MARSKVLVTGGTGFLGKRLGRALRDTHDVVLAGRNNKQNFNAEKFTGCRVLPLDVARIDSVRDVFVETRPDIVIHAAATKFVDRAELEPMECIDINVIGSQHVARVAMERGTRCVIGVSTDKASPPVRNTYGLSKAIMERMFCALDGKAHTRFACVRYGNVAWSTGSVLPIWREMHRTSGVIRTTGPDMRRFFFSADDAVQLVLTAVDNLDRVSGCVLARRMKAAQIMTILDVWTRHKGGRWERMEGRPGERDDEYLIGELELAHTEQISLGTAPHYVISFNRRAATPLGDVVSSANAERLTEEEILAIINAVPEEEQ